MNKTLLWAILVSTLSVANLLSPMALAQTGPPPALPPQEGVEVQARGPVHEDFAEPVVRGPRPTPVVNQSPPEAVEELPPEEKPAGGNVIWIPGYWAWDEDSGGFLWVSGTWRALPPNRQWVPGHWSGVPRGWPWVARFWAAPEPQGIQVLPPPPPPVRRAG